jgi:hypothetical protein
MAPSYQALAMAILLGRYSLLGIYPEGVNFAFGEKQCAPDLFDQN